jgi:hypothetical protein
MPDKKIAWENWDSDVLDQEMVDDVLENEDFDEETAEEAIMFLGKIPKLVTTPAGVFQLNDKMNVLNQFDCWMGHTNFGITKSVERILENIEGVEFLSVIGRYRFFIGVGRLFNFSDIRVNIEDTLCNIHENSDQTSFWINDGEIQSSEEVIANSENYINDAKDDIKNIKEIVSDYKHWAIFVGSNGILDYATTNEDDDEEYLQTLTDFEEFKRTHGGTILHSKSE